METLVTITKVLGLITLCVIFILILLAIITAPYRQRNEEKARKELQDKLIKKIFEQKDEKVTQPKKRVKKSTKNEEK